MLKLLGIMKMLNKMKLNSKHIILIILLAVVWGCQEEKDIYLMGKTEESVDKDLMTLLKEEPNYSKYVELLELHQIDTIFDNGKTITMFIPTNDAIESIQELHLDTIDMIRYLIIESYVNIMAVDQSTKIKTLSGKFMVVDALNEKRFIDNVEISKAGPLGNNGKYFEINEIVQPRPNLYEYIQASNPFFKNYIDQQDSVFLNLELSTPIGYNDKGETVYDSVISVVNLFEEYFFPVSQEFRTQKATMLLFDQFQFDNALNLIAEDLSLSSSDAIPDQWKNDILLPYLINQGVFWNELNYADFATGRIRNIIGDSVNVDPNNIDPFSDFLCSNGKVYSYLDFSIPDSLYKGSARIQGENLVISKGFGLYAWSPDVVVSGAPIEPEALLANDIADNDSVLVVAFDGDNYAEEFAVSFYFENIFPGKYQLLFRAKTTPSGVFEILVNGEIQEINLGRGGKDFVDIYDLRNPVRSITKEVFRAEKGFNSFDILVENITEYGEVEVTIRYKEPGQRSVNGLVLDYVDLISYTESE